MEKCYIIAPMTGQFGRATDCYLGSLIYDKNFLIGPLIVEHKGRNRSRNKIWTMWDYALSIFFLSHGHQPSRQIEMLVHTIRTKSQRLSKADAPLLQFTGPLQPTISHSMRSV